VVFAEEEFSASQWVTRLLINDGSGGLQEGPLYVEPVPGPSPGLTRLLAGDFDNDQRPDILLAKRGEIDTRLNLGGALAAEWSLPFGVDPWDPWAVALGHFDTGATLDVAFITLGDPMSGEMGSAGALYGAGDGTLSTGPATSFASHPTLLASADFDGDGVDEMVTNIVGSAGDPELATISFADACIAISPFPIAMSSQGAIAAGDLDGDGKTDLAVVVGTDLVVFRGRGDMTFFPPLRFPMPSDRQGTLHMTIADVNHDDRPDVVVDALQMNGGTPEKLVVFLNQTP
jgi:hypothetical protein